MSTIFDIEQAHQILKTPADVLALCRRYRGLNPDNYRLYPDVQKAIFCWQDYEDKKVAQNPIVLRALNSAPPAHPSTSHVARQQQAQAARAMVNRAMTTPGQPIYEPAQQPVQRGAVAPNQQQVAELRQAVQAAKKEIDRIGDRIAAAGNRGSVKRALVQRNQAEAPTQPVNQYPISPLTGQPSSITAVARQSVGAGNYPILNQPAYYQQVTLKAEIDAAGQPGALPISPLTGQPSELTAITRRSVGLK